MYLSTIIVCMLNYILSRGLIVGLFGYYVCVSVNSIFISNKLGKLFYIGFETKR